jgi:hypothetical protein
MSIPPSWAIALAAAAATGIVVMLAIAADHDVIEVVPRRWLVAVAHLLGGGVAGFTALGFYPAWPLLAAVLGMLVVRALRIGRILDVGLLTVGFGSAWTLLVGRTVLEVMTDPAVHAPLIAPSFVIAIGILIAGLLVTGFASFAPVSHRT